MQKKRIRGILTLSAEQVMACCRRKKNEFKVEEFDDVPEGTEENQEAVKKLGAEDEIFCLELDSKDLYKGIYQQVVLSCAEREENAFFYQLKKVKEKKENQAAEAAPNPPEEAADTQELSPVQSGEAEIGPEDLIFMDFKTVVQKRPDIGDENVERLFRRLYIRGTDKKFIHMVPFDRSASMSRSSVITFINERWKKDMDDRLTLGIYKEKKTYPLSKYYAYRGLYLSTGRRVEAVQESGGENPFALNEETVVVIPDVSDDSQEVTVFTKLADGSKDEKGEPLEYGEETHKFQVNCFDGEGLIAPEYAEILRQRLEKKDNGAAPETAEEAAGEAAEAEAPAQPGEEKKGAQSFQIRMPFIKGMLHTVDFQKFFREELGIEPEGACIRDFFGEKREISKIRIVLTASMCKACHYLDKGDYKENFDEKAEGLKEDPFKYYFRKFYEYNHALYILRTDTELNNPGYVRLNYQFLNTAKLTKKEMEDIVRTSLEKYAQGLKTNIEFQRQLFLDEGDEGEKNGEIPDDPDKEQDSPPPKDREISKTAAVLKRDETFFRETKIQGMVSAAVWSRYVGAMRGGIIVKGENRFLSGDLLYLLRALADRYVVDGDSILNEKVDRAKYLKEEKNCGKAEKFYDFIEEATLAQASKGKVRRFYAPQRIGAQGLEWQEEQSYAVLRNPHLSRNEQCAMKPYTFKARPDKGTDKGITDDLYAKYFKHLTGVIMLPYASPEAMRLSGADFDGDLVKIIDDKLFNQSAEDCFNAGKTPLVEIPSGSETGKEIPPQVEYKDIRNVFDSRVGQLSNLAVRFGLQEYNENAKEEKAKAKKEKYKDYAARCCILVGQEIDKPKTGVPPQTSEILSAGRSLRSDFLRKKDQIRGLKILPSKEKTQEKDPSRKYYRCWIGKKFVDIGGPKEDAANLEDLMYTVIDCRVKLEEERKAREKDAAADSGSADNTTAGQQSAQQLPEFNWAVPQSEPDPGLKRQLALIMTAYFHALKMIANERELRQQYRNARYRSRVYNILLTQYDQTTSRLFPDGCAPVGCEEVTVDGAVERVYRLAGNLHKKDSERVKKVFEDVVKGDWKYLEEEMRKDRLEEYFSWDDKYGNWAVEYEEYQNDLAVAKHLFRNFSGRGYGLLYYVLKDVVHGEEFNAEAEAGEPAEAEVNEPAEAKAEEHAEEPAEAKAEEHAEEPAKARTEEHAEEPAKTEEKGIAFVVSEIFRQNHPEYVFKGRGKKQASEETEKEEEPGKEEGKKKNAKKALYGLPLFRDRVAKLASEGLKMPDKLEKGKEEDLRKKLGEKENEKQYLSDFTLTEKERAGLIAALAMTLRQYHIFYKRYYDQCREIELRKLNAENGDVPHSRLAERLDRMCRSDIREQFQEKNKDMIAAVECWYSVRGLDKNHRFLWAVFSADEILHLSSAAQKTQKPGEKSQKEGAADAE